MAGRMALPEEIASPGRAALADRTAVPEEETVPGRTAQPGCIVMASGLSRRYGKNKLLEDLDGREVIRHVTECLVRAGLAPLVVTRSRQVKELMELEDTACILHDGPRKSDTIHVGLEYLGADMAGYLFMPADQPLLKPETVKKMLYQFSRNPRRALRAGYAGTAGSPVLFPAFCREALLAYEGDRGGLEVLKKQSIPCDIVEASREWELWDVDTPEKMERVRAIKVEQ